MTTLDKRSLGFHCGWFTSYLRSLVYILPNGLIKQVLFLHLVHLVGKGKDVASKAEPLFLLYLLNPDSSALLHPCDGVRV